MTMGWVLMWKRAVLQVCSLRQRAVGPVGQYEPSLRGQYPKDDGKGEEAGCLTVEAGRCRG